MVWYNLYFYCCNSTMRSRLHEQRINARTCGLMCWLQRWRHVIRFQRCFRGEVKNVVVIWRWDNERGVVKDDFQLFGLSKSLEGLHCVIYWRWVLFSFVLCEGNIINYILNVLTSKYLGTHPGQDGMQDVSHNQSVVIEVVIILECSWEVWGCWLSCRIHSLYSVV